VHLLFQNEMDRKDNPPRQDAKQSTLPTDKAGQMERIAREIDKTMEQMDKTRIELRGLLHDTQRALGPGPKGSLVIQVTEIQHHNEQLNPEQRKGTCNSLGPKEWSDSKTTDIGDPIKCPCGGDPVKTVNITRTEAAMLQYFVRFPSFQSWRYKDAPSLFKTLSDQGGDEDNIVYMSHNETTWEQFTMLYRSNRDYGYAVTFRVVRDGKPIGILRVWCHA